MTRTQTATCQDCGWTGPVEETKELRDVWDRVLPGDVMPAGECPQEGCGAAAMLDEPDPRTDRLRTAMETLTIELERLRTKIYTGRLQAPIGNYLDHLAKTGRKALAQGPLLQPVCSACGGSDVRIDAWACWDPNTQRWQLHSTYEPTALCGDCGGDCSYAMKPVPR